MKTILISTRPRQWLKNLFVFAPLIFGLKLTCLTALMQAVTAAILFTLTAAGVYLVNDVLDIEKDRKHPLKRSRPIAAGSLNLHSALLVSAVFFFVAILTSYLLEPLLTLILAAYILSNWLYSKFLKQMIIIDAMCFAWFFLLRIIAGAVVVGVKPSHWILICSALLTLFLAFGKRYHELRLLKKAANKHRAVLMRYSRPFLEQMMAVTTASLVVFYTLYTIDAHTIRITGDRRMLFTVPFVYYGIFRYLYNIYYFEKGGDPTEVVLWDRKLQITIALWLIVVVGALYL